MDDDQRARIIRAGRMPDVFAIPCGASPIKEPFGVGIGHVDTAVAHGLPKVIVPIGAVEAIVGVEVLYPFDIGQVVIVAQRRVASRHRLRTHLHANVECPCDRGRTG